MSIEQRRGGWTVRYRGPDRKERTKHFARKRDALDYEAAQRTRMQTGDWTPPEMGRVTVARYSEDWVKSLGHLKVTTLTGYLSMLELHVKPTFGPVPLVGVTREAVVIWVTQLSGQGLAPSTVRQAHQVLALILQFAMDSDRVGRNVARGVRMPRARPAQPRFLSRAEVEQLAGALGGEGDVVRFLALTGLRFGEMAALRVARLDLLRRRAQVVESVAEVGGHLIYSDDTKNHKHRSVPLAASLLEPLARRCAGKGPEDFVFTAPRRTASYPHGGPLRLRAFRVRFDRAVVEAGLPRLTPHDLRDTAASLAVSAGANVKVVQRMLGHKSATMTLDVYAGLFDDDLDEVAARMDGPPREVNADYLRTAGGVRVLPLRPMKP